ncbi:acyl-CoA carboxylase subunit epsilon [Streptomyces hyaluromycini]|uniref:acyl-CoA carboxylase subunit epsilon n=1 Tax=Streptomyces hyaluromycini TaxID=1377993 RepID=UPI000B5C7902|nr:acyl-CoA carboxylase subunit epsilon [Streptomyces hyaluromycini]
MPLSADHFFRVEKGHAQPEELAAITTVLVARIAREFVRAPAKPLSTQAGWRRLDRNLGFCAPHSWQN